MRIAMIGSGYVGLVSGACFAQFGHDVVCVDKDAGKIARLQRGEIPIYEPGLDRLVADNVRAGRLAFGISVAEAVPGADAVFIAVGTPTRRGDGHADLSYVYAAAKEITEAISGYTVIATKSTVPVGTGREVARIIRDAQPAADFDVASNPEFLREGAAIEDFMKPDRVVIGVESERAREVMAAIYRPLNLIQTPIVFTNIETAEVAKYAGNAFLATKITFINEIADLCEKAGADVHDVARAIGLDGRIGRKFLHPGPGFGGSCFPKDTLALAYMARAIDAPQTIVEQVIEVNNARKKKMADKVINFCGGSVADLAVGVLGLTFKPNTDDMRDAPSLDIIPALQVGGASIMAFDPQGMPEASRLLSGVTFVETAYEAADRADLLVVITEWPEFRALDPQRLKRAMRQPRIVDLRNIFDPKELCSLGFIYEGVGRPIKSGNGRQLPLGGVSSIGASGLESLSS
jgi:UDPglucose 6-dehydrogenase